MDTASTTDRTAAAETPAPPDTAQAALEAGAQEPPAAAPAVETPAPAVETPAPAIAVARDDAIGPAAASGKGAAAAAAALGRWMAWRPSRFSSLAATIAVAAGLGSIAGAAGYAGVARLMTPPEPKPAPQVVRVDNTAEIKSLRDTAAQLRASFKQLSDNVGALRASIEGSGKGGALAKIGESVARLNEAVEKQERSSAENAQRIAKTVDAMDRLEKRAGTLLGGTAGGAADVTGSVAGGGKREAAPAKAGNAPPPVPIVEGWRVRQVIGGDLAILEGPDRVIEIEVGDTIRGIGRVSDIRRLGGRWAVVTARGLIVSR
jgi:methyl-accepting chemotaxis protein